MGFPCNEVAAAGAAVAAAAAQTRSRPTAQELPSLITVEVVGYGGGSPAAQPDSERRRRRVPQQSTSQVQDPQSPVQVPGAGAITQDQARAPMRARMRANGAANRPG